jgi:hypothetical protein
MQKVVGSSPIIRSPKGPGNRAFLVAWNVSRALTLSLRVTLRVTTAAPECRDS